MADCIEWEGSLDTAGYGQKRVKGRLMRATHYVLREQLGVDVPSGMMACHTCDNRKCVNGDHLWIGTNADNMADMKAKGRGRAPQGTDQHLSKLTEEQVLFIKANYVPRHPELGGAALGRKYGVHKTTVTDIIRGKSWPWLQ